MHKCRENTKTVIFVPHVLIGLNVTLCLRSVKRGYYIHRGSRGGVSFELCAFVLKFVSNYLD